MMRDRFQSATLKLTAYYMAIIMLVCFMFSGAIYHFASNELQHSLARQSQRLEEQYPGFDFTDALRSTKDYRDGTRHILFSLLYFNLFVLLLAGFGGYELAKRTLRPIAESLEQQKRFTADVSHELRTPLTALRMTSEVALMDKTLTKTQLRDTVADNLDEAAKMELLVTNLLRLTRLEATSLENSFTAVDIAELLRTVISESKKNAAAKKIQLSLTVAEPVRVRGDLASLSQLLNIIVDNAIKYSPANSTIEIDARHIDSNVRVQVTDHGSGIEAGALPHVFERFYRGDSARTRSDISGFGLGLSIAKHIADLHHGTIRITSTQGEGTTADIDLSRAQ